MIIDQLFTPKKLYEFAPSDDDSNGSDPEEMLRRMASYWWNGTEKQMSKVENTLAAMGWEIGQDDGYDDGGVFVVRAGDEHGGSYISWPHEDLELNEGRKKKKKKTSRSLGRYFFPGYGYYGSGESGEGGGDGGGGESADPSMAEGSDQQLSIRQLATISDEALDKAYGYGRSSPGNTFGWQANLKSAAYAKNMIDKGVTDIDEIADAIHKGWNVTAKAFVKNPNRFDDTEKLKAAGKLEAKLQQRAKLMNIDYSQLPDDEQEKDRVVARALLQAITGGGEQNMSEGEYDSRKPFGVRYKVFAGREGRLTTREYYTSSEQKLQRAVDKIQALDNFYEIDGYSYPKEQQGVAEGSLNELSKDTLKSYAKKAVPDMQASQKRSEIEAGKAASTKDDTTAKTHYDAAKQARDRTEKRMAGISGAIKRVTKQGVAEGSEQKPAITYKDYTLQYDYQTEDDDPEGYSTATTYYFDVLKDGDRVGEAEYFDYFGNLTIIINGQTMEFKYRHPLAMQISQLVSSLPDEQKKDLSDPRFESQGVAEGLTEMDKSQTPPGRDTGPREGPEKIATPITKEKMVKHATDILNRPVRDSHKKKDVKEGMEVFGDEYLRQAANPNRFGTFLISVEQAQAELDARAQGKSRQRPATPTTKPRGFSKEYLQSVVAGTHPRPVISKEEAQELLNQMNENINPLMKKLRRALIKEGRVKELALDLKIMPDADFMKKYGKAKAAIRADMKRVDEAAQTNYTPQEMADILSGKKTQQQVDAERNKRANADAAKTWADAERDATRIDDKGRRIDKNGKLRPSTVDPMPNAPLGPTPGNTRKYQNLEEEVGQQFVGTGTSSNWQMSVDIAAMNARRKAAQSIAGTANFPNGVQLPAGTKYGPQDTKSDGTGKYVSTYIITLPAPSQSAEPAPAAPANNYLDSSPATSGATGSMSIGAPAATGPAAGNYMKVNELSTNKLSQYKTAAARDAKKADQAGDFKRGDKRLSGMVQATKKQFDNDAKKVDESRAARRALMARIVNSG